MNESDSERRPAAFPTIKIVALVLVIFAVAGILWWQLWGSRAELEVWFFERLPYHVRGDQGKVSGIFADRVSDIMNEAGIDLTRVHKSASLHLNEVKKNERPMCISG